MILPPDIFRWIAAAAVAVLLFAAGFVSGCRWAKKEPTITTKIEYTDRPLVSRDTITIDRPVTRRIFHRVTDTVYVRIPVPTNFDPVGVISAAPIRISRSGVTLTYFNPDSLRFMQDVYAIPQRRFGLYVDAGAERGVISSQADVRLNLRYKIASAHLGYGIAEYAGEPWHGWIYGARLKLAGWR